MEFFYNNMIEFEKLQQKIEQDLTAEELRERLKDPHFLPSREQIMKAFAGEWDKYYEFCFDKESPVFEFFNEEYLNALVDYFVLKIQEYEASEEKPLVILELAAGNGKLSYFLQQKLEGRVPGQVKVMATEDIDHLHLWNLKNDFSVERIDSYKALEKYNPTIVIVSWMAYGDDSSAAIRDCKSVKEYILIGETEGGSCGHAWKTWGYQSQEEKEKEGEKSLHTKKTVLKDKIIKI